MEDLHLSAAMRPCPNANRRDFELVRNFLRKLGRYKFQHHREGTCILNRLCIANELLGGIFIFALHTKAAKLINALWRQANMCHHWNTGLYHALNGWGNK